MPTEWIMVSSAAEVALVGRGHERMWPPVDLQAGPRQYVTSYPLHIFEMCIPLAFPVLALRESVSPSELCMWLNPVKASMYKLFRFWRAGMETSLPSKFPCLLKLPAPNPEWTASFCSFSLLSVYQSQVLMSLEAANQHQLINVDRMMKLEKHHFTAIVVKTVASRCHQ